MKLGKKEKYLLVLAALSGALATKIVDWVWGLKPDLFISTNNALFDAIFILLGRIVFWVVLVALSVEVINWVIKPLFKK